MSGKSGNGNPQRNWDFPGFAQEFLRRNPAYRRDYETLSRRSSPPPDLSLEEGLAGRWGLQLGISIPTVQYHVARALAHIDAALERE